MIELAILRLLWKWKRQGMDEEKATKDKNHQKTHFSVFNVLHSTVHWNIHWSYANDCFRVHCTSLLANNFLKNIKCVFWFFIGFTTAMNMISGLNWGKASFLIFFKILFLFLFFTRLDNQWNQISDKLMMISKAKLFRVEKKGYLEISDSGVLGLLLFENSNYLSLLVRVDIFLRK